MNQNLKKLIKTLIKEYTGTGDSGGNAGDGNNVTSQRSRFDDPWGEDEMEFYLNQNKGRGGDGGHYKRHSTNSELGINTHKFVRFEELENYIKQVLEEMEEEVEEQAYGSATLTTQGQRKGSSKTKHGGWPGVWMEKINEDQAAIDKNNKKIIDNTKENNKLQLDNQQLAIDMAVASQGQGAAEFTAQISDLEAQIQELNMQENEAKDRLVILKYELGQFPADILDYTPEQLQRQDDINAEIEGIRSTIQTLDGKRDQLTQQKQNAVSQRSAASAQASSGILQQRKALRQRRKDIKKQERNLTAQSMSENKLYKDYLSSRKDKNLMEYMDSYKREILLEKAISKFFKLFDDGKTDEEVLKLYAEQGVIVPEPFVKKARDKHKKYKHEKLDLEELEQETKEFKKIPLNTEIEVEEKALASGLFKEQKTIKRYDIPPEIRNLLENTLKMYPLVRFVKSLKAVNSIPPSYEIFLLNNQSFFVYYEEYSLMIKIGTKEYYEGDLEDVNYAIKHINKLLTQRIPGQSEEEDDLEDLLKPGGAKPDKPLPPPPKPKSPGTTPPPPVIPPPPPPKPEDET